MEQQQQSMVLNVNDGRFSVTISEDAMTVWGDFIPARGTGKPVEPAQIDRVLADEHIVHGIQVKVIQKAAAECARTMMALKMVPVALGTQPVAEVPPYVEMRPEFDPNKKNGVREDEKGQVEYRDFSPFTIVRQDEYLAVQQPGNPGKNGCDVYGQDLPFEVVPCKTIQPGKNVRVEKNGYYAAAHGQLLLSGDVLNVEETLVIKGSVGYATGHIDFPGNITIHGFVNDGFKLYSGGTITCKHSLDVTDVGAKGGLNINGGIIGRLEATMKIGDAISVRFMDQCNFFSGGDITVHSEIVRSTIHTKGRVTMGEESSIISSTIHSFHSVNAANITNRAGKMSAFYLGMDFNLRDVVNANRLHLDTLTKRCDESRKLLDMAPENRRKDMEQMYEMAEMRRLVEEKKLEKLLDQFYVDPAAELLANGEIARGTRIEICGAVLVLPGSLKEATFRLSENGKHIVMDTESIRKAAEHLKLLHGRRRVKESP